MSKNPDSDFSTHLSILKQKYRAVLSIRNSLKYVASRGQKEFMRDLKPVYQSLNKDQAEENLSKLSDKWRKKYQVVIDSWTRNWEKLSTYFQCPAAIRKLIYTTNAIE